MYMEVTPLPLVLEPPTALATGHHRKQLWSCLRWLVCISSPAATNPQTVNPEPPTQVTIRGFFCTLGTIRGAVVLHDTMLANVMRAPTKFFDTTPTGRVLNRFSSDQYTADNELRQTIQMMLMCLMRVACVAIVILWVTPAFIVCVVPMGFIYYKVQAFYRQSSREMKRLESVAKSPIFAEFSETITGISTIRAFGKQEKFSRTCFRLNDAFSRAYYANNSANRCHFNAIFHTCQRAAQDQRVRGATHAAAPACGGVTSSGSTSPCE